MNEIEHRDFMKMCWMFTVSSIIFLHAINNYFKLCRKQKDIKLRLQGENSEEFYAIRVRTLEEFRCTGSMYINNPENEHIQREIEKREAEFWESVYQNNSELRNIQKEFNQGLSLKIFLGIIVIIIVSYTVTH